MADSGADLAPGGDPERAYFVALVLAALAAAWGLIFASQWGLGVTPDSVNYLKSAEKLLAGQGVFSLKVHWPPGYPTLLAAASTFGSDLLETTRWLHAVIYFANVVLLALLARPRTIAGRAMAVGAALFFAASTFETHFMAWSEPPFVALQLASTLLLCRALSGGSNAWLWGSALFAAGSVLVRFAGFPFVATASAALLFWGRGTRAERWRRALAYGAAGCGPALVYMFGNKWVQGEALDRVLFFEVPGPEKWAALAPGLAAWFSAGPAWLGGILAAASLLAIGFKIRERSRPLPGRSAREATFRLALAFVLAYALFMLSYMTLLDRYLTLNARILFPAQAFFALALSIALVELAERRGLRALAAGALVLSLLIAVAPGASARARRCARAGYGELERKVRGLPILALLKTVELPVVYSNGPDLVYLYVGGESRMLPRLRLPETGLRNPAYADEMREVVAELERGDAVVVLFPRFLWRTYLPRPAQLEAEHELKAVYRAPDGIVYTGQGRPLRRSADPRRRPLVR